MGEALVASWASPSTPGHLPQATLGLAITREPWKPDEKGHPTPASPPRSGLKCRKHSPSPEGLIKPAQELALEELRLRVGSPPPPRAGGKDTWLLTPRGVWRIGMELSKCRVQNLACVSGAPTPAWWCGLTHAPGSATKETLS